MNGKRKSWVLGSLLLIMAVMVLGYITLLRVNEAKSELASEEEEIVLYSLNTETAREIKVVSQKGEVSLIKEGDNWYVEGEETFPLDQSYISGMLSAVSSISAKALVKENADNLEEYGLSNPVLEVSIALEDKTIAKLSLGNEVPIQGGYYGLADDGNSVYIFDSSYYTSFDYKLSDLMTVEAGPEFNGSAVTAFTLDSGKGTIFEAKLQEDLSFSITGAYSQAVRGDTTSLTSLFSSYSGLSYGECVEYNCKDSKVYGITEDGARIEIQYEEEEERETEDEEKKEDAKIVKQTFILQIGDPDEEGHYYVQPKGSSYVYKMDEDTVESLLYVEAFSYVSPYIISDTLDMIDTMTMETKGEDGKKAKISIKAKTTKNEDGEESTEYTIKKNGKTWDYDDFSDAFQNLSQLAYIGEMKEENPSGREVYAVIELKNGENTKNITLLEYDKANFYQVLVDGEGYFLTEIKAVQSALEEFLK